MTPERIAKLRSYGRGCWAVMTSEEVFDLLDTAECEARYASELERCCEVLDAWPEAIGCNGRLCVSGHLTSILAEIRCLKAENAELRAAIETKGEL